MKISFSFSTYKYREVVQLALKEIKFVTAEQELKDMAYGDTIYAWLLLHSHYNESENHNYIYKKDFTFTDIGKDIGRTRQTVSKRFKELLQKSEDKSFRSLIWEDTQHKCYILPCFRDFQKLDSETVLNLFRLSSRAPRREELIKTYAWLKKQFSQKHKDISYTDLITVFGHSRGNEETYNRYKDILTTLQGAGLIKFRTDLSNYRGSNGLYEKTLYIYQVNDKASKEWLDANED